MFRVEELCPRGKKDQYKKVLVDEWKKAETIYEQILVLKVLGNAALDNTVEELQKIVKDKQQPTLIRMEAVSPEICLQCIAIVSDRCYASYAHRTPTEDPPGFVARLPKPARFARGPHGRFRHDYVSFF
jgi:hypothetical protein